MVDFPNGTPALPDILLNDPPGSAASGLGLRSLINRANDNILALINDLYNKPLGLFSPVLNGGPLIWADGTSFAAMVNGLYLCDQWRYITGGTTAVHTGSQSTDVPAISTNFGKIPFSIKLDVTTADAAVAAGDIAALEYLMDGYSFCDLAQREFTARFWVKSPKTGIHCVAFLNSGQDRSYVAEFTINVANTWEEKSVVVPASPSAGTWNYTTGTGIRVRFPQIAGTTYQTATPGVWTSSGAQASSNQQNLCDNTANDFYVCGLSMFPGPYAPPFILRPYSLERALCRTFYQKTYQDGTAPGTNIFTGMVGTGFFGTGGANAYLSFPLLPPMRLVPTVTLYGKTGTTGQFYNPQAGTDHNAATVAGVTQDSIYVLNSTTATEILFIHYVANARLS